MHKWGRPVHGGKGKMILQLCLVGVKRGRMEMKEEKDIVLLPLNQFGGIYSNSLCDFNKTIHVYYLKKSHDS
jgi:hypothetical protein